MRKYIFLDNWVIGRLNDDKFQTSLIEYIQSNRYVVVLNSLSLTELYNPNWQQGDRTEVAAKFYASIPCVIVDPAKVKQAEVDNYLDRLDELPIEIDLTEIDPEERERLILGLLRCSPEFVLQGKDLEQWDLSYKNEKSGWLNNVDHIISHAINTGSLKKGKKHRRNNALAEKETFLLSLDMREVPSEKIDLLFQYRMSKLKRTSLCSSVRFLSLLFWYLYIDEDPSNKIKHQNSDIGDLHQMTLIPYCEVFTLDNSMFRLVNRVKNEGTVFRSTLLTKAMLEKKVFV
ncbi:hypothetical protein [Vibrio tapetis]|uniref:Uncharacterized protein n=1 Tax=Vibrio tapetis subsp. tapetis TaxID=1671868 RepID=A0A2N8ZBU1_9VIBR|nr:hypothetical protein [Vibrio tapetis]SON49361.1 protein of unknown function [Vibrio tapetis subsp. tapetis]